MRSMLQFDQTTLANMTAALEFVCRKPPHDRDTSVVRKNIAAQIIKTATEGLTRLGELTDAGLNVVNQHLFPPSRSWLRALG